jgi:hypothetical protein
MSDMPSTPKSQPTKPASTDAPTKPTCRGCEEEQPNQLAHVGPGGCLKYDDDDDSADYEVYRMIVFNSIP